jgi:hypothetical protein
LSRRNIIVAGGVLDGNGIGHSTSHHGKTLTIENVNFKLNIKDGAHINGIIRSVEGDDWTIAASD